MNATTTADPVHSKALPDLVTKLLAARQQSLVKAWCCITGSPP